MVKSIKIVAEKHADGYVAYPVGIEGVVIAQGDTREEAVTDARSAIKFHIETFGSEVLDEDEATEVFIDQDEDRASWLAASQRGLQAAYGDDEPEYSLDVLKEENPEFRDP